VSKINWPAVVAVLVLIAYMCSMNAYVYYFDQIPEHRYASNWWCYSLLAVLGYFYLSNAYDNELSNSFKEAIYLSIFLNIAAVICNNHGFMVYPQYYFYIFNGSILFVSLCILTSGFRHGLFKR
jgi:hypothetical protein